MMHVQSFDTKRLLSCSSTEKCAFVCVLTFTTRADEPLLISPQPVWSVVLFNSQLTKVTDVNFTIFNKAVVLELF